MSNPGSMDNFGVSHYTGRKPSFEVPVISAGTQIGGSNRDVGSLALFLVTNWFVNGETVLIDGGVMFPQSSMATKH